MSNPLRPGQMTPAERLEDASKLLLNGFQAASFRIPAEDFHDVMELLGEDLDELPAPPQQLDGTSAALAAMEKSTTMPAAR